MFEQLPLRELQDFLTSLAIGLLIGLERERHASARAGLRTFALVALLGTLTALLAQQSASAWPVVAGLLSVAAMIVSAHHRQPDPEDPGTTSVVAALVCFCLGAAIRYGHAQLAVSLAVAVTGLLYFKTELRGVAARLSPRDWRSMLQFAALSLIVLPQLPDRDFGPYGALNPYQAWLMVVLIAGVSLAGYAALRLVGVRFGAPLLGILGGLVSSTATTLVFARRTRESPTVASTATVVILLANLTMLVRVALITVALAPGLVREMGLAVGVAVAAGLATLVIGWRKMVPGEGLPVPEVRNPTELRSALGFGGLYALVLLAAAWLSDIAGSGGLFAVSLVSGLTDIDAITLSTLRLHNMTRLSAEDAVTAIGLAMLANLAFKTALTGVVGGRELLKAIAPSFTAVALGLTTGLIFVR